MEELRVPLALTAGALVGVGGLMLAYALRRRAPRPAMIRRKSSAHRSERQVRLAVGGIIAFALTLLVTRWVVLAVVIGGVVALWDRLLGGGRAERQAIVRAEGLAAWIEALRDTIAGAIGLEQAIPATAKNAAPSVRPALNLLVDRLRVREPLPDALMRFADDLDDPSADVAVAALVLNARLRGPGLREVLSALAESARAELDVRRRVESSRRSTRRSVQIVVGVIVVVAGALVIFNGAYVEPYGTFVGQIVLAVVLAMFGAAVLWMRRLSGVDQPERFLIAAEPARRRDGQVVAR
ncbi:type II secretion system F family protein [Mumia sp. zg.B21]|uniref:type II secretion system F family protein n=1 Tax=unclassified Mumia TaxID=2621872 RepID=UPI001C6E2513|nr:MULTISPECIES: type II secretion system F family protein [unclassified Mumia]MBW9208828.1 type II secretion system F family protein [Mumia sp. zg.B21]MDD9349388.1 type II secretion system F family protein [Mumia sp.]